MRRLKSAIAFLVIGSILNAPLSGLQFPAPLKSIASLPCAGCAHLDAIPPLTISANRLMFPNSRPFFSAWRLLEVHTPGTTPESVRRHGLLEKMEVYLRTSEAIERALLLLEIHNIFLHMIPSEELVLFNPFLDAALVALQSRFNPSSMHPDYAAALLKIVSEDLKEEIAKNLAAVVAAHSQGLNEQGVLVGPSDKDWENVLQSIRLFHHVALFAGLEDLVKAYVAVAERNGAASAEGDARRAFNNAVTQIHQNANEQYLSRWVGAVERLISTRPLINISLSNTSKVVTKIPPKMDRPEGNEFTVSKTSIIRQAHAEGMELGLGALIHDSNFYRSGTPEQNREQQGWINRGPLAYQLLKLYLGFAVGHLQGYVPRSLTWNELLLKAGVEPSQVESRGTYSRFKGGAHLAESEPRTQDFEVIRRQRSPSDTFPRAGNSPERISQQVYVSLLLKEFDIEYSKLPSDVQEALSAETLFHQMESLAEGTDLSIERYRWDSTRKEAESGSRDPFFQRERLEAVKNPTAPLWLRDGLAVSHHEAAGFIPRVARANRWLRSMDYSLEERKEIFAHHVDVLASIHFQQEHEKMMRRYGQKSLSNWLMRPDLESILARARNERSTFSLLAAHPLARFDRKIEEILIQLNLRLEGLGPTAVQTLDSAVRTMIIPAVYTSMPLDHVIPALELIAQSFPSNPGMWPYVRSYARHVASALPFAEGNLYKLNYEIAQAKRLFPQIFNPSAPLPARHLPGRLAPKPRRSEEVMTVPDAVARIREFLRERSGVFFAYDQIARQLHIPEDVLRQAIQQLLQAKGEESIFPSAAPYESRPAIRYHPPEQHPFIDPEMDLAHAVYAEKFAEIFKGFLEAYQGLPRDEALSQLNGMLFDDLRELFAVMQELNAPVTAEELLYKKTPRDVLLRLSNASQVDRAFSWCLQNGYFILHSSPDSWELGGLAKKGKTDIVLLDPVSEYRLRSLRGKESLQAIRDRFHLLAQKNGLNPNTLLILSQSPTLQEIMMIWGSDKRVLGDIPHEEALVLAAPRRCTILNGVLGTI